jgi:hypothetical protein
MSQVPVDTVDQEFTELLAAEGLRIERNVSNEQASPPSFWYDQASSEWGSYSPDRMAFCLKTSLCPESRGEEIAGSSWQSDTAG